MAAELLIRPGYGDNIVIADLLAPGGGGRAAGVRPPLTRIVLDAAVAVRRPQFAEVADAAAIPLIVDPQTHLLQGDLHPAQPLALVDYASLAPTPALLDSPVALSHFVAVCVLTQLDLGATAVVPPYFHAAGPDDPWFELSLACLNETAAYMSRTDLRLPVIPVFTGRGERFGREDQFDRGVDRFATTALNVGASLVGMQLSPMGQWLDNYDRVLRLFQVARRLRRPGLAVHAWRQGVYGPALVAAGLQGYETGIGMGETTALAAAIGRAKEDPRKNKSDPDGEETVEGAPKGSPRPTPVMVEILGRSLSRKALQALRENLTLAERLQCSDPVTCCTDGLGSSLNSGRRAHAIRSRARALEAIDQMPPRESWRLHKVARDAQTAVDTITIANKVLLVAKLPPINASWQHSLGAVARFLRGDNSAAA